MNIEEFLDTVLKSNRKHYDCLMFNLYEDEVYYTIEAVFDDEALVIGRDDPVIICGSSESCESVQKRIRTVLNAFYRKQKSNLSNLKRIAFGFVDGDLHDIKENQMKKVYEKDMKKFTAESFKDFDIIKLDAWIHVYVKQEDQEKYNLPIFPPPHPSKKTLAHYRKILADNFDYEAYYSKD